MKDDPTAWGITETGSEYGLRVDSGSLELYGATTSSGVKSPMSHLPPGVSFFIFPMTLFCPLACSGSGTMLCLSSKVSLWLVINHLTPTVVNRENIYTLVSHLSLHAFVVFIALGRLQPRLPVCENFAYSNVLATIPQTGIFLCGKVTSRSSG